MLTWRGLNMNTAQTIHLNEHCVTYKSTMMDSGRDNRGSTFAVDEDSQVKDEKAVVSGERCEDIRAGDDTRSEQIWWEQEDEGTSTSVSDGNYNASYTSGW